MDKVEITVSGRIPKYYFGRLKSKYQSEIEKVDSLFKNPLEADASRFIELLFFLTLERAELARESFRKAIDLSALKKLPAFNSIANYFLCRSDSHWRLIEWLFDPAFTTRISGRPECVLLFEDDASISINVNRFGKIQTVVNETSLKDFSGLSCSPLGVSLGHSVRDSVRSIFSNQAIGVSSDQHGKGVDCKNTSNGCVFLKGVVKFEELRRFDYENSSSNQVTIFFDDITMWQFQLVDDCFRLDRLIFTAHQPSRLFRESACETVFNNIWYNGNLVVPTERRYRDKGIEIYYGVKRGNMSLSSFLNAKVSGVAW